MNPQQQQWFEENRWRAGWYAHKFCLKHRWARKEEVENELLTELWKMVLKFQDIGVARFSTYAFRGFQVYLRHLERENVKKMQRGIQSLSEIGYRVASKPEENREDREDRKRLLDRILAELPSHMEVVVRLHYLEGLDAREIGKRIQLRESLVWGRIASALTALRRIVRVPSTSTTSYAL